MYVADNGNGRVVVFDRQGNAQRSFAVPGLESQPFSEPQMEFDGKGRLWITVPLQHEVRAYDPRGKMLHALPIQEAHQALTPLGLAVSRGKLIVTTVEGQLREVPLPE